VQGGRGSYTPKYKKEEGEAPALSFGGTTACTVNNLSAGNYYTVE
jgi:hypothetical protein